MIVTNKKKKENFFYKLFIYYTVNRQTNYHKMTIISILSLNKLLYELKLAFLRIRKLSHSTIRWKRNRDRERETQ